MKKIMTRATLTKIAAVMLVVIGLVSIYEPINPRSLHTDTASTLFTGLESARCLKSALPQDVHLYGFMPVTSQLTQPLTETTVVSDDLRERLFVMRYILTPDLISDKAQGPWLIAFYPDRETALPDIQMNRLKIVTDCGNGIFLLKR